MGHISVFKKTTVVSLTSGDFLVRANDLAKKFEFYFIPDSDPLSC